MRYGVFGKLSPDDPQSLWMQALSVDPAGSSVASSDPSGTPLEKLSQGGPMVMIRAVEPGG